MLQDHIYHEEIHPLIQLQQKKFLADVKEMAYNSAHSLAFHRGLGVPLYPIVIYPNEQISQRELDRRICRICLRKAIFRRRRKWCGAWRAAEVGQRVLPRCRISVSEKARISTSKVLWW